MRAAGGHTHPSDLRAPATSAEFAELAVTIVMLPEVTAESALAVMNVGHNNTSNYGRLLD